MGLQPTGFGTRNSFEEKPGDERGAGSTALFSNNASTSASIKSMCSSFVNDVETGRERGGGRVKGMRYPSMIWSTDEGARMSFQASRKV